MALEPGDSLNPRVPRRVGPTPLGTNTYFPEEPPDPGGDITVTLPESSPLTGAGADDAAVEVYDDGTMEVDLDGDAGGPNEEMGHTGNLAETITDESYLGRLASEVIEMVTYDLQSRAEWDKKLERGLEILGLTEIPHDEALFPGASSAVYPLLAEACVQFQARALDEIFPPSGPVKGVVIGDATKEKEDQRDRVEAHMNYQLTVQDKTFFWEVDKMLFQLPLSGSAFKKVSHDEDNDRNISRLIDAQNFIVPYTATSLEDASRYTHRYHVSRNAAKVKMFTGEWRTIDLQQPSSETSDVSSDSQGLKAAIDKSEGRAAVYHDKDHRHTIYEQHREIDLPGHEHKGADGHITGIKLPYVVTVDLESQRVLAIRRNWREDDKKAVPTKRMWFIHFKYLPGLGFYGYGLVHLIGGLCDAATGTVRSVLDSAAFASLQGGFKASDAGGAKSGEIQMEPGVYKDINMTADELAKAFYTPPFKEPSPAMMAMLQVLIDAGRRFASITESNVGDASNTGPVGTTVALIEQASKVFSAIHKRLHRSQGEEFQLLARLNFEYLPPEGYPYEVHGASRTIMAQDYDDRVDIIPASDPNIFSQTQRIAIAQAAIDLSTTAPQLYNAYEVHRRMHEALRTPDIDAILIDPHHVPRADPVSENMMLLVGRPAQAYPDQAHEAHIAVHMAFMQNPEFGGGPEASKIIGGPMAAHIAQHLAYLYAQRAYAAAGVAIPVNLAAQPGEPVLPPMDPQVENQIAMAAAQHAAELAKAPGLYGGNGPPQQKAQPDPAAEQQQKMALAEAAGKADEERKQQSHQADLARAQEKHQQGQAQAAEAFQAENDRKDAAVALEHKRNLTKLDGEMVLKAREQDNAAHLDAAGLMAGADGTAGKPGAKRGGAAAGGSQVVLGASGEMTQLQETADQIDEQLSKVEAVAGGVKEAADGLVERITKIEASLAELAAKVADLAKPRKITVSRDSNKLIVGGEIGPAGGA